MSTCTYFELMKGRMSREGERGNECDGGGKARWTKILHVAGCLYLCLCAVAVSTLTSASSSFINPYLVSSEQGPRLQLPAQQLEDRQTQQEAVHPPVGQQWQAGQLGHLGQIERHINVQRKHLLRLAKCHHLSTPGCLAEWLLLVLMLTVDLLSMGSLRHLRQTIKVHLQQHRLLPLPWHQCQWTKASLVSLPLALPNHLQPAELSHCYHYRSHMT